MLAGNGFGGSFVGLCGGGRSGGGGSPGAGRAGQGRSRLRRMLGKDPGPEQPHRGSWGRVGGGMLPMLPEFL